jgi:hypothetical protein
LSSGHGPPDTVLEFHRMTIEKIVSREKVLREAAIKLSDRISNPKVKEGLRINQVFNALDDINTLLIPWAKKASSPRGEQEFLETAAFNLRESEERIKYAEKMLAHFGPNLEMSKINS